MRDIRSTLVTALAAFAVVAAACTGGEGTGATNDGDAGGGDTGAATPSTFTYSVNSEVMIGWDPASGYSNEVIAMHNIYETLTRYDAATQEVEPLLAESWEASEDGLTWTFTLREGVTFHTGNPLTAEAAKAAIERTMELGEAASYIWAAVEEIETPDERTLVFQLSYPSPLDLVSSGTYSAYIYDTEAAGGQDLAEWFAEGNDAGTGPYTVAEYNPGDEIELRLEAYPDYWGGWDGDHYENYVFRVTPEANTAAQLLRAGEVTMVQRMSPQLYASFEGEEGFETSAAPSWQTLLALLNTADGPLADERVRDAVALAIDYEGIIAALEGAAEPLSGVVPPGLWGHTDGLEYEQNVAEATALLEDAGYGPNGDPMTLELTYLKGDADEELVATLMKSNLTELNIDLQTRGLQWQTQWDKAKSDNEAERQDILVFYWWPDYPDPVSWFYSLFRTEEEPFFNLAYYSNPDLDAMIDEASVVAATDRDEAASMYAQMQEILVEDAPAVPVYTQTYQRVMQDEVDGFEDNPA
ncbi:MAG TPA: ABC transporter substrate-binding protein, partial [Actinomycetota bacterium]|nr:ABC transporter substrate-binding protein [Actinomycetota bacterium]